MIGYPITYGDNLEEGNGFTSEMVIIEISEYWSSEKNRENFYKGYKFGLLFFSIGGVFVASTVAFAEGSTVIPDSSNTLSGTGAGSSPGSGSAPSGTPGPEPATPAGPRGSVANVLTTDRGVYTASALGICSIAMKTGAFYLGFVCAAAVLVGVHMAGVPAKES